MDIDIFDLPGILKRRIHYVIWTAVLCAALALGFVLMQKPYFRSTAELLVDLQRGPVVGLDNGGMTNMQQTIASQTYVFQSRALLLDVVNTLDLVSDPYLNAPVGMIRRVLRGASAQTGDEAEKVVTALQENLVVDRNGDTFVFTIRMTHRDSAMAARIANAIAEAYLRTSDASNSSVNQRTSTALELQTEELSKKLLEARARVEAFKAENGFISTGEQGLVADQQLAALNQQLLAARQQVEQLKTAHDQVRQLNVSDVEAGAIPEALQSTALAGLRSRYSQMLDRQAELSANLGDGHPQMRATRSQLASIRSAIQQELGRIRQLTANNYERAQANLAAAERSFDQSKVSNEDHGDARFRLAQLESEAASIDAVYRSFLTRAEELGRQQDIGNGHSRIISYAVPSTRPIQAPKLLVLIAALLFGTAAGSALAVLRELLNGTVRSERELVKRTGVPVLAIVASDSRADGNAGWGERFASVLPFHKAPPKNGFGGYTARESGLMRAAHLLRAEFGSALPATVVVLSAGSQDHAEPAAAGIARLLHHEFGEEVLFSDGSLRREERRPLQAGRSVKVRTDFSGLRPQAERSHSSGLEDLLHFERLGSRAGDRKVTAISAARISTGLAPRPHSFTIIDACGTPALELLPAILKQADGFVLVSKLGTTVSGDLATLMASIEPWRKKLIGNILIGDRAA